MPRAFSSFSRSGSVPVSASTSELFPWSMWPAVPTTTFRISRECRKPDLFRRHRAEAG